MSNSMENSKSTDKGLKKDIAERAKAKKERDIRVKKRLAAERKKLNKKVSYPSSIIMKLSLLILILTFVIFYYGKSSELLPSLYNSFVVFSGASLIISTILIGVVIFISEHRKIEIIEKNKFDEERKKEAENKKNLERLKVEEELRQADIQRLENLRKIRELNDNNFNNSRNSNTTDYDNFGANNNNDNFNNFSNQLFQLVPA